MNGGNTIFQQLKDLGSKDLMCWGARAFKSFQESQLIENSLGGLLFRVNGMRFKGQVLISLNAKDCYDIHLGSLRKGQWTTIKVLNDICVDELILAIDSLVEGYYEEGPKVYEGVNFFESV